jgi:uncharacterized protein DUF4920
MKRTILVLLAFLALTPALRADQTLGSGVKEPETTSVSKILANPDAYVGRTVRIEGQVVNVCPMKGCWMELEERDGGARFRVKVDDGVIVFPVTAKGKIAVAEGTVESIPMSREQYVAWLQHLAEERGQPFDPKTVGEGPFRILQLRGTGARVAD